MKTKLEVVEAAPAPPPDEIPTLREIPVIDYCGAFGYLIPWANWKAGRIPIVPTTHNAQLHVYLYSQLGQLGDRAVDVVPRDPLPGNIMCAVNVDKYLHWPSKRVDWASVYHEITVILRNKGLIRL